MIPQQYSITLGRHNRTALQQHAAAHHNSEKTKYTMAAGAPQHHHSTTQSRYSITANCSKNKINSRDTDRVDASSSTNHSDRRGKTLLRIIRREGGILVPLCSILSSSFHSKNYNYAPFLYSWVILGEYVCLGRPTFILLFLFFKDIRSIFKWSQEVH